MLKTTSQEFRTFFLLEFTRELINSFAPPEVIKLETIVKEEEKEQIKEIKAQIKEKKKEIQRQITPRITQEFKPLPRPLVQGIKIQPLPPRLQYLRPIPKEIEMNLGKLNPLIKDLSIKSIECNGPGRKIIVNNPNSQSTSIILTKEEIDEVIKEFSRVSKIPLQEGVYKVAAGKFILLSAISEIVGTKFILRRIPPVQNILQR